MTDLNEMALADSELVERLRYYADTDRRYRLHRDPADACRRAADRIATLSAEVEKWEKHATTGDQVLGRTRAKLAAASARADVPVVKAEAAREAVQELANVKMDLSLEDWCRISNTILSALVSAPAQEGWREMGSAPKDGSWILVRLANGEVFRACWHLYGQPGWHVSTDIGFVNAKHWMPLPASPEQGVSHDPD